MSRSRMMAALLAVAIGGWPGPVRGGVSQPPLILPRALNAPSTSQVYALFGTSITANSDTDDAGTWSGGTLTPNTPCTTPCGTAISASYGTWLNLYLNSSVSRPANTLNFGVVGDITSDMLARVGTVVAARPDLVVLEGGANDMDAYTCAQTVANLRAMYAQFLGAGIAVVRPTIYPRTGAAAYDATGQNEMSCINTADRAYAAASGHQGFFLVDLDDVMGDPATSPFTVRSGYLQSDNVHPNEVGGSAMGWAIAQVINKYRPSWLAPNVNQSDAYDATNNPGGNMLPALTFSGSGGSKTGCTGTAATNFTFSNANAGGAACALTVAALSDGANEQTFAISGSKTGSNSYFTIGVAAGSARTYVNDGDTIEFCGWVKLGSNSNISGIQFSLAATDDVGAFARYAGTSNTAYALPAAGFASGGFVRFCTPRRTITGSIHAGTLAMNIYIYLVDGSVSPAGTFELRDISLRKVQP
jgi:lysophospholipase L1-like esterase